MADTSDEFDVEADEGEDGELAVRGAPPMPPPDPEPIAHATMPAPPPEVKRIGRPRKERPAPPPVSIASTAPHIDISKRDDEWPKDPIGLWMKAIAWAKSQGRGPEELVIYVHQMRGPTGAPMMMTTPIYGEQVMGSEEQSAGEALYNVIIDDYHIATTTDAASYRIEIRWRANSLKIKTSDSFPLDRQERILRQRQAAAARAQQREGGTPFTPFGAPPTPFAAYYPHPGNPYVAHPARQQQGHQAAGDNAVAAAAAPSAPAAVAALPAAPPAPPPTGNPYLDEYIATLRQDRMALERRAAEQAERLLEKEQEIAYLRPPPPAVAAAPISTQADEDARNARLASTIIQTLVAAGLIAKPGVPVAATAPAPPAPPPTQEAAGAAVSTIRANTGTLETVLDELERAEKLKTRMRSFLGVKESDEEEEEAVTPTNIHVEPAEKEMKVWTIPNGQGGTINLPRYDKDDDETTTAQKIINFFGANPNVTKDVVGHVMGIALTKLSDGPLAGVIGQLLAQGGAGAMAAGMARNAVNGAGSGGGGAGSA